MGYIKSIDHFINYCRKISRDNGIILLPDTVNDLVYFYQWAENYAPGSAVDFFTWSLKQNPNIIASENLIEDVKKRFMTEGVSLINKYQDIQVSSEFFTAVEGRFKKPGVYSFFTKEKKLIYVGRSFNLAGRVIGSLNERREGNPFYVRFIDCKTKADACIVEAYMIGKHKPSLNGDMTNLDDVTLKITNIPKWGKFIKIFNDES